MQFYGNKKCPIFYGQGNIYPKLRCIIPVFKPKNIFPKLGVDLYSGHKMRDNISYNYCTPHTSSPGS